MKTGFIVIIGLVVIVLLWISLKKKQRKTTRTNGQIRIDQLATTMTQLINGELENEFFGITSDGIDCIYFNEREGEINIDFEVMRHDQISYADELINYAIENGYQVIKTTYGNEPHYPDVNEAPVYRVELNANVDEATKAGTDIMENVFMNNEKTWYDIVP